MPQEISSPFERAPTGMSGKRCVVLDATADAELWRWIYQLAPQGEPQWTSLFHGTEYAALSEHGPALVLSEQAGDWVDYASALLEQSNGGCVLYLDHPQDWSAAVEHCQSLLTVTTHDGRKQLMRFFEPRWLEPLLVSLTAVERDEFLGPFSGIAWRNELGWRYVARSGAWSGAVQKPGWLHLGPQRQQQITQARLQIIAAELTLDYQSVLTMPEPTDFVFNQLLAAQAAGAEQKAHYERWLRLALCCEGANWPSPAADAVLARKDLVMTGKLDELERLQG
ncbi:DUF4123 domain-containing protein [Halopseudomonas sabulinigri]|uniref:DUF4123 domain-containing protein n=1 Tax=Halopseudomonas sabulinigri TaxID=472181 RepID=A0A1H1VEW7_9GAMM|nr:DUF4123 domain-containing protein [Halopseudomonas sabulinigri]SDS82729.1 protein of unknown function [Halopseudomonas sabulinigri]